MINRISLACVAATLMAGTALAQTSTTAPADTNSSNTAAPTMTAPSMNTAPSAGSSSATSGQFITEQTQDQFRASKLVGLNVYGTDNQKIGDINEILMDAQGTAKAVVIGVGGFLGIGEKNVAVPFSALTWSNEPVRSNATASNTSGAPASTTASNTGSGTMGTAGTASTADSTGSTSPARSPDQTAASRGYPDHAVLSMTKDQLKNAPDFKYYSQTQSGSGNKK